MRLRYFAVPVIAWTCAAAARPVLTGTAAFGDWHTDAPGVRRHITPDALPVPYASGSASRAPGVIAQPRNVMPVVPAGFTVSLFASGLDMPRTLRTAPNGDVFLAESGAGRVLVFTGQQSRVFASNLTLPFGIGFWPPGPSPRFVYVAETNRVVRFRYPDGGPSEVIVAALPEGGHWTRDIAFSPDGARMFVSVGSETNVMTGVGPEEEQGRADVLSFTPDGKDRRIHAVEAGIVGVGSGGRGNDGRRGDGHCRAGVRGADRAFVFIGHRDRRARKRIRAAGINVGSGRIGAVAAVLVAAFGRTRRGRGGADGDADRTRSARGIGRRAAIDRFQRISPGRREGVREGGGSRTERSGAEGRRSLVEGDGAGGRGRRDGCRKSNAGIR